MLVLPVPLRSKVDRDPGFEAQLADQLLLWAFPRNAGWVCTCWVMDHPSPKKDREGSWEGEPEKKIPSPMGACIPPKLSRESGTLSVTKKEMSSGK